jgi:predicted 3-demethylubiquinone-9 3-methyltransferase (glyoxalase superfamily)
MQKIVTYLWFDNQAEEAANYYTSLFPDSKIASSMPGPDGNPMVVNFQLAGQEFIALNGGPQFKFTEAISLLVNCQDQAEVDRLWNKLVGDGGEESQCGWLKDKYGLSWQIIPTALGEMLGDPDREKAGRAMQAMLQMRKIDVATMRNAFEGR